MSEPAPGTPSSARPRRHAPCAPPGGTRGACHAPLPCPPGPCLRPSSPAPSSLSSLGLLLPLLLLLLLAVPLLLASEARAHGLLVAEPAEGARRSFPEGPALGIASHRVTARIEGPLADVEVEVRFHNLTALRLEGTYLFPLPEGAAVSRFAMTLAGRMVEG